MREFELLRRVYRRNAALGGSVEIPPGDDLAMMRLRSDAQVLAGVDQLVAGRHVDPDRTPVELIGRKAIARSLSDIAAMAASPVGTLVAVTLPPDFGEDRAEELFEAMRATAAQYDCPLIGGDIAFHSDPAHPLVCAVTVLAEPAGFPPITRAGAKPGDRVYVTGMLGGTFEPDGGGWHLHFEPRIREAIELAGTLGGNLHAMIDLSDGLGRDCSHIATMSGVSIALEADRLPCRAGADWRAALGDGEDYELCFTARGKVPERLGELPITHIGEVTESDSAPPGVWINVDGTRHDVSDHGWQHES